MVESQGSITKAILWLAVSVVLVVTIIIGMSAISNWFACDEAERTTFAEFPQFGDWEVEPWGSDEFNACVVSYDVPDTQERIEAYFDDQLIARGWTLRSEESQESAITSLAGRRGDYVYRVFLRPRETDGLQDWTHVEVRVNREPGPTVVPRSTVGYQRAPQVVALAPQQSQGKSAAMMWPHTPVSLRLRIADQVD